MMTVPEIFGAIDEIVAKFNSDIAELKSKLAEKPVAKKKPAYVQQELPFETQDRTALGIRPKLGDAGYADAYNPVRQAVGRTGGMAGSSVKRASCPDRRKRGTVNVVGMSVNQHREYWRWCAARKKARAVSAAVPSWETWKSCVGAR